MGGSDDDFEDPFAIGETDELSDLPPAEMNAPAADYRRVSGADSSITRGGGASLGPDPGSHLNSSDLVAAMQASSIAGLSAMSHGAGEGNDPKFLHYERRSLWGQCSYNIGYSYFGGLAVGGFYGLAHGLRTSPNNTARVLLNSVLNGCGKFGARTGNAAGVLALVYTVTERQIEDIEIDSLPGKINNLVGMDLLGKRSRWDVLIPATTAFATGVLFTLPKAITMRGIEQRYISPGKRFAVTLTGGVACMAGVGLLSVIGPFLFKDRSPFRFA